MTIARKTFPLCPIEFTSASPTGEIDLVALDNVLKVKVLMPYLLTDALSPLLADGGSIVALTIAATQTWSGTIGSGIIHQ